MRMPTIERRRRPSNRRIALIVLAAVLVVLLVSLRGIAGFYTDYLWFKELGYTEVWRGLLMAKAFPKSRFFGFDYHDKSIEAARDSAKAQGLGERISFEVAKAKDFPGKDYDFVAVFDCLHDMGDPVGAAAHVRQSLAKNGTWMIVEPFANDQLKDNLNPVGRVYYSFSTLLCTPCSRSQEVALCLGAQAGEKRIREVVTSAGFSRFRRATETPFNIVYEARP